MPNQIKLELQKFDFNAIQEQFPSPLPRYRKLFFQCELKSVDNGIVTFGVICYPAWRINNNIPWTVGTKVNGTASGQAELFPIEPYIAFGNNEVILAPRHDASPGNAKHKEKIDKQSRELTAALARLEASKPSKAEWRLKAKLYTENQHLEYDVTLDDGGSTTTEVANPCPPFPPD